MFGIGTTLVNILVFWLLDSVLSINYLVANIAAWILAVAFAYITNKLIVFGTKEVRGKELLAEAGKFFGARLFSLGVDEFGMWLLVDILGMAAIAPVMVLGMRIDGTMIAKIIMNITTLK